MNKTQTQLNTCFLLQMQTTNLGFSSSITLQAAAVMHCVTWCDIISIFMWQVNSAAHIQMFTVSRWNNTGFSFCCWAPPRGLSRHSAAVWSVLSTCGCCGNGFKQAGPACSPQGGGWQWHLRALILKCYLLNRVWCSCCVDVKIIIC